MQSLIILGSESSQHKYIQDFIQVHNIKQYQIHRLEEKIKISDVHDIVQMSHMHLGAGEKRVIIFNGEITLPAQNALLKFLEELPDNTFVFFLVNYKDQLLETITSRSNVVKLDKAQSVNRDIDDLLYLKRNINRSTLLLSAQSISSASDYENFLISLRSFIIQNIFVDNLSDLKEHFEILQHLHQQYQIVKENNINPKFTIEIS